MSSESLEWRVGEVLASMRNLLGVARARCYAMDPRGNFRLSACYGFPPRTSPEDVLSSSDPLLEWVQRHRKPAYANAPIEAGPLQAVMERDRYARVLVAPIYGDSRLLGILELQDRLGGVLFGPEDLRRMDGVVARLAAVLREYDSGVTSPEPLAAEDAEALFASAEPPFLPPPPLFDRPNAEAAPPLPSSSSAPPDDEPAPRHAPPPELTGREVILFRGFANTLLLQPEVEAVVFSFWSSGRGELYVGARRPFSTAARDALVKALESALSSSQPQARVPSETLFNADFPLGREPGELESFAGLQTSVIFSDQNTLLLTLVLARPVSPASESGLAKVHGLVRSALAEAREARRYRASYRALVNALVEPGARHYPQLKAHCFAVGALCRRFAASLGLGPRTVEQFTVAGLLHDIGLRELDLPYERVSGRRPLDLEELAVVRQHPVVGAAILDRIDFPYSVAPLVRHHHERFDGAGYPGRLAGERIPLGSRVIALADAYDALTAPHSYRSTVSPESAIETLILKGGTQFDPELARRFAELIRSQLPHGAHANTLSELGS